MQLILLLLLLSSVFCSANERNAKEDIETLLTLRQAIQSRQGQDSQEFAESLQVKGPTPPPTPRPTPPTPFLTHKPTDLPTTSRQPTNAPPTSAPTWPSACTTVWQSSLACSQMTTQTCP